MMTPSAIALVFLCSSPSAQFLRWEKEITGIEARLAKAPAAKGGVVFAGSSSIRLWNLEKSFPGRKYVNVGFGGSEIRDTTHFADRILLPLEPKTIVFYAGDNDIAKKRTPEQLRDDFAAFTTSIHAKLPQTRILYLPVKPSLARWSMYGVQQKANALVKSICESDARLTYVDLVPITLGSDGKPKPEFFVKDGLHLSEAGYKAWSDVVRTALE
jgi:lysophospholipase L1-like esterase